MELESLNQINLTTFLGLMALTTVIIGTLKAVRPSWIKGYESIIALVGPAAIGAIVKLAGWGFADVAWWPGFVVGSLAVSVGSGLVHDKLANPLKSLLPLLKNLKEDKPAAAKKKRQ